MFNTNTQIINAIIKKDVNLNLGDYISKFAGPETIRSLLSAAIKTLLEDDFREITSLKPFFQHPHFDGNEAFTMLILSLSEFAHSTKSRKHSIKRLSNSLLTLFLAIETVNNTHFESIIDTKNNPTISMLYLLMTKEDLLSMYDAGLDINLNKGHILSLLLLSDFPDTAPSLDDLVEHNYNFKKHSHNAIIALSNYTTSSSHPLSVTQLEALNRLIELKGELKNKTSLHFTLTSLSIDPLDYLCRATNHEKKILLTLL